MTNRAGEIQIFSNFFLAGVYKVPYNIEALGKIFKCGGGRIFLGTKSRVKKMRGGEEY